MSVMFTLLDFHLPGETELQVCYMLQQNKQQNKHLQCFGFGLPNPKHVTQTHQTHTLFSLYCEYVMCIQWLKLFDPSKFIVDSVSQKEHVHKCTFLNPIYIAYLIHLFHILFFRPKFVASDILVKMSVVSRYFIQRTARRNGLLIKSQWEQIRKF